MRSALSVYRGLLRASRDSFKTDTLMLTESRREIRSNFEVARLETNVEVIKTKIGEAEEAAIFIRQFVVQGVMNNKGNFEVKLQEQHADKVISQDEEGQCSSTVEKR
mmetsp:Transcript_38429/g.64566  ORF Transcript_38429/g.64566 Transcript_38429/m.64566 type:complete len:107 (-) Transcript_38429:2201-2521(-)